MYVLVDALEECDCIATQPALGGIQLTCVMAHGMALMNLSHTLACDLAQW